MDDEAILRSLAALNAHTNSIEARLFSMKSEPSTPSQPRADHGSTEELYEELHASLRRLHAVSERADRAGEASMLQLDADVPESADDAELNESLRRLHMIAAAVDDIAMDAFGDALVYPEEGALEEDSDYGDSPERPDVRIRSPSFYF